LNASTQHKLVLTTSTKYQLISPLVRPGCKTNTTV
jgi:hypothetical protein